MLFKILAFLTFLLGDGSYTQYRGKKANGGGGSGGENREEYKEKWRNCLK